MDNNDIRVQQLVQMIKLLNNDAMNNETFNLEDYELIQDKTIELMEQLNFWNSQDNKERFCYELTRYIKWFLKTFS